MQIHLKTFRIMSLLCNWFAELEPRGWWQAIGETCSLVQSGSHLGCTMYRLLAGKIGRAGLENSCCEYLEVRG